MTLLGWLQVAQAKERYAGNSKEIILAGLYGQLLRNEKVELDMRYSKGTRIIKNNT